MSDEPAASIGGTIGPRIAALLGQSVVATRQKMAGHQAGIAQKVLADFTNHVSDEVQGVMGPLWREMAENPDTPEEIRPLLHSLGNLRGQAWAWIGGTASGAALGAGIMDLLNNLLAPAIQPLIAADPNATLSPETAANAAVRGLDWTNERANLEYDAQAGGIDRKRYKVLQQLAEGRLTHTEVQELFNRYSLSHDEAIEELHRSGYTRDRAEKVISLGKQLLSGDVIAQMLNRDILSFTDGVALARQTGMTDVQLNQLAQLYGDPLSPQLLGDAYRRGFISREEFERGIIQGPLRKEWFDTLEKLQLSRMSTVDAADAVNQGHIPLAEGKRIAYENGLDADDFAVLIESAGQPPGIEFADEAFNRGFISDEQYSRMFLESRIKNRYLPLLRQMRTRLIPQETARLLYRQGVYTESQALQTLLSHGFSAEDAAALLAVERTRSDDNTRELTRSQIVDMYEERMFTASDATTMLTGMGYSADDAQSMLELAELQRLRKFINSAVSKVHAAYVAGKITEIEASSALDYLGIPNESRDDYMALWDIERTTVSKTLTASQIRQAVAKGLIDRDNGLSRLVAQGYDVEDASLYLQLTA